MKSVPSKKQLKKFKVLPIFFMSFSKKYHYHCRLRFRNLEKKQKYFQKYLLMLEYLLKLQQEWLASLRIQISQFLGLVPKNKTNDYSTNCCFLHWCWNFHLDLVCAVTYKDLDIFCVYWTNHCIWAKCFSKVLFV